jgi:hypothetical protein
MANRKRRLGPPIHASIREALGYDASQADDEIYADWKERTGRVCKPCWELKYCPYGPLIEQSPLLPALREGVTEQLVYFRECLKSGMVGNVTQLTDERREFYAKWSKDEQILLGSFITESGLKLLKSLRPKRNRSQRGSVASCRQFISTALHSI